MCVCVCVHCYFLLIQFCVKISCDWIPRSHVIECQVIRVYWKYTHYLYSWSRSNKTVEIVTITCHSALKWSCHSLSLLPPCDTTEQVDLWLLKSPLFSLLISCWNLKEQWAFWFTAFHWDPSNSSSLETPPSLRTNYDVICHSNEVIVAGQGKEQFYFCCFEKFPILFQM